MEEEQQIERASRRDNNSRELIEAIMKSQASREERVAKADDVVDNTGDGSNLDEQVERLHQLYLSLSQ